MEGLEFAERESECGVDAAAGEPLLWQQHQRLQQLVRSLRNGRGVGSTRLALLRSSRRSRSINQLTKEIGHAANNLERESEVFVAS
ncbi:hypothetical protein cyc_05169 [Cyclospora cayetanensis]|uniref:Uncharacterized protein n=1 Tax=Cyclospora cayetanensis TaxID=88456 RepID=A0A1D3DA79_9EIME|nr:hypothetical protein cyc_05169 [Cyclospora cayetanensis]